MSPRPSKRPDAAPRRNPLALKIPPVLLFLIHAALMWFVSRLTPALDLSVPAKSALSTFVALIGAAVCVAGVVSFRRAKTTVNPLRPESSSSLVVSGIYKHSRNPMYLGLALILLGWAVFLANVAAAALLCVFVLYLDAFQIVPEERVLASRFPDEYARYQAAVRRWI